MSSRKLKLSQVFTPNDTPTITYVDRSDLRLESNLAAYLSIKNMVVSISGPSKTGKTVLISKVISDDEIIPVIGAGIEKPDDLWNRALHWMDIPQTTTQNISATKTLNGSAKGSGEGGFIFTKAKIEAGVSGGYSTTNTTSQTFNSDGLTKVIAEIGGSDFVIFLDDFHYIKENLREEIGRQIKVAADNGVRIVTASVPHRADDVVRSNPELRGRVAAVDMGYWSEDHLALIAKQGFDALNVHIHYNVLRRMCQEAMGSPQLMQTICFNLCLTLGFSEPFPTLTKVKVTDDHINRTLDQTSQFTDFSKMLASLHSGPRTRGQERKEHAFTDGTTGDVYRAVLLAIRSEPISMSFTYDDIMERVRRVCTLNAPVGSSVTSCLEQMHTLAEVLQPGQPILVWDGDTLDITDPYFSFFLRCSNKINELA